MNNILVENTEEKRQLERNRHRWEDSIKINLRETGCKDVDWIHLAQVRVKWWCLVNSVIHIRVP
jgi:hypothetical protein